jgi:hypothetical protein
MQPRLREPETPALETRHFGPSEAASPEDFRPGDFIRTHGKAFFSKLIRFGQAIQFRGRDHKYAWWNHAAMWT